MSTRRLTITFSAIGIIAAAAVALSCDTRGSGITGIVRPISGLSSLGVSAGVLAPTFNSNTTNYTLSVPNATTTLKITPVAATGGSIILVNGNDVPSGGTSPDLPLITGSNNIDIFVQGPSGASQRTYRIVVTRQTT